VRDVHPIEYEGLTDLSERLKKKMKL
jgi:hypothetical protein